MGKKPVGWSGSGVGVTEHLEARQAGYYRGLYWNLPSSIPLSETSGSWWQHSYQVCNQHPVEEKSWYAQMQGWHSTGQSHRRRETPQSLLEDTSNSTCTFSRRKLGRGSEREIRWTVVFSQTFPSKKQVIYQSAVILPTVITLGLITSGEQ